MKIKQLVVVLCSALWLAGCAHSVATYKKNSELRHSVLKDCVLKGLPAKDDANCINASKAQAEVVGDDIKNIFK